MEYTLKQKRFINKYVEKVINGDAAIFAGAGLSTSTGCVNWNTLPNAEATILLLGYVAMTRSGYQRKVPKLNYERDKFKWAE